MTRNRSYPGRRESAASGGGDHPGNPAVTNLPWIDVYSHAHTLSWNDRERYSLSGCAATILIGSAYHYTPYRPREHDDVRFLWDDALARMHDIRRSHFFNTKLAVGVSSSVPVADQEALLESMREYCRLEEVMAVGEIDISKGQLGLGKQETIVRSQMEIAADAGLPVILHTPPMLATGKAAANHRSSPVEPGPYRGTGGTIRPAVLAENPSLKATKLDLDLAERAGLSSEQVVVSHADPSIVEYVMEHSDSYLSFSVGYPWVTGVKSGDVAAIETYSPERILVDSDVCGPGKSDVSAINRTIFEFYDRGFDLRNDTTGRLRQPADGVRPVCRGGHNRIAGGRLEPSSTGIVGRPAPKLGSHPKSYARNRLGLA